MKHELETNRLTLKILKSDYAAFVLDFYSKNRAFFEPWDPKHLPSFYTLAFHKLNLNAEYTQMLQTKFLRYFIFLKENPNKIIGTICYQNFLGSPYHSCLIGYKMDYNYIKHGYMCEAITKSLEELKENYSIHRIEALIAPYNTASIRLIEKLNFQYEGINFSSVKLHDIWEDYLRYSYIID